MSEPKDLNLNRHLDRERTSGKAKQPFNVLRAVRGHVGTGLNVDVYRVIADRLALPRRSRRNQVIHTTPPRRVDFRRLR
jgi:hypothetical protein